MLFDLFKKTAKLQQSDVPTQTTHKNQPEFGDSFGKCGSTAQVKLVCGDDLRDEFYSCLNWVSQSYKCGCGCEFSIQWKKEGVWVTNE